MALLQISNLRTHFQTPHGTARAVDRVSLEIKASEVLGVVGESGCGKSVLALSILQLLPMPPAFFAGGEILFDGQDLLKASPRDITAIRGNRISMIFQEPMTALNPVFTVGNQISEVYRVHQGLSTRESMEKSIDILDKIGVPAPAQRVREFPYQLSGGLRQRIMIAMALACRPALLIADEPTTALDVTIQAQILELMSALQKKLGTAIMMISHDLGVIAETTQRVVVMYAGVVMESAGTLELFDRPLHPYTQGLMRAIPSAESSRADGDLYEIRGTVPSLYNLPGGCPFHPRCPIAEAVCKEKRPELTENYPGHQVACWKADHD